MEQENTDKITIKILPEEMMLELFKYLDPEDFISATLVAPE